MYGREEKEIEKLITKDELPKLEIKLNIPLKKADFSYSKQFLLVRRT
jgi:hypothetical protein